MWHTQLPPPILWATLPMPPMLNLPIWHTMCMAMALLDQSPVPTLPMWLTQYQVPMLWAQWPMPLMLCQQVQQDQPILPTQPIEPTLPMWHTQLLVPMSQAMWPMPPMLNLPTWHTMCMAMALLGKLVPPAISLLAISQPQAMLPAHIF